MTKPVGFEELQQYQIALNNHAIVSVADISGKIIEVNDKFCAISGYSREELLFKKHSIINSGVHDKTFFKLMWSTILAGNNWSGNICNRRKNGELYWVDSSITPILDNKGKPIKFISIRTDITAVKRLEIKSVATSGRREKQQTVLMSLTKDNGIYDYGVAKAYETISSLICDTISANNSGIWLLDKNDTVFECVMLFTKSTQSYQQGMRLSKKQHLQFFDLIQTSRILNYKNTIMSLKLDNRKTKLSLAVPIWFKANLLGFISIDIGDYEQDWHLDEHQFLINISDFIAQFLHNCKMKELQVQLLTAQRMVRVASWELDLQQKKFYWSDEMYDIYGVEKTIFIPEYDNVYDFIVEQDKIKVKNFELNIMSGLRDRIKYQIIRHDGAIRYLDLSGEVHYDQAQQPKKIFGAIMDITEQINLEKKLNREQGIFQHIFNKAHNALLLLDSQQKIMMVNPKFSSLLGYHHEDIVGQTMEFLFKNNSDYKNHFETLACLNLSNNSESALESEILYKHKDCEAILLNTVSSVIEAYDNGMNENAFIYLESIHAKPKIMVKNA